MHKLKMLLPAAGLCLSLATVSAFASDTSPRNDAALRLEQGIQGPAQSEPMQMPAGKSKTAGASCELEDGNVSCTCDKKCVSSQTDCDCQD